MSLDHIRANLPRMNGWNRREDLKKLIVNLNDEIHECISGML